MNINLSRKPNLEQSMRMLSARFEQGKLSRDAWIDVLSCAISTAIAGGSKSVLNWDRVTPSVQKDVLTTIEARLNQLQPDLIADLHRSESELNR